MAMSDNPQYAHVHVKQQKGLKAKMQQHHAGAGEPLPEQMELLALSSDSCSTYPPERTSPSLSANVMSPTNNSVFNYNQIPNQQRHAAAHQHQQQQQQQQRNIIYQANSQVHLHSNGITPQMIAQPPQHPTANQSGQMNPLHVAQQLSPPHTLHPNQQMSTQLQHAVQQHKQQQRYQQQQQAHLVPQQQPIYNQSISPNSIPSEPAELIKVLSQALVGQQQLQHQQQAHLFMHQSAHQSRQPQMSHHNDLLKRRLSRWERLTNQNRNYLLSLNNKEDQFRAICALSLLAVPEPQH